MSTPAVHSMPAVYRDLYARNARLSVPCQVCLAHCALCLCDGARMCGVGLCRGPPARTEHQKSMSRTSQKQKHGFRSTTIPAVIDGSSSLRSPSKLRARWGLIPIEPTPFPGNPAP